MSEDTVLRVDKLGKCFKIYSNPWHRVMEWVCLGKRAYHHPFWALKGISFEVCRGEFLGIIGQNGAGKSTLLKILSGVLQPTTGTYHIEGKVISMLELGMDFNPYLSGRENTIRSAELWGFPRSYVQQRIEQIAEFSELGVFFERPVGLYSTGMALRLAFSLFAFLECDVLILDEILAVGDLFFRQKCYARLEELITNNTTIIAVTHEMDAVQYYCKKVILLEKGKIYCQNGPREAISSFYRIRRGWGAYELKSRDADAIPEKMPVKNDDKFWPPDKVFTHIWRENNGHSAQLIRLAVCDEKGKPRLYFTQGDHAHFYFEFHINRDIGVPIVTIWITNRLNQLVHGKASLQENINVPYQVHPGSYLRFTRNITLNIKPGEYVFSVLLTDMHPDDYYWLNNYAPEKLIEKRTRLFQLDKAGYFIVTPLGGEGLKGPHLGICDLPGDCHFQVVSNKN